MGLWFFHFFTFDNPFLKVFDDEHFCPEFSHQRREKSGRKSLVIQYIVQYSHHRSIRLASSKIYSSEPMLTSNAQSIRLSNFQIRRSNPTFNARSIGLSYSQTHRSELMPSYSSNLLIILKPTSFTGANSRTNPQTPRSEPIPSYLQLTGRRVITKLFPQPTILLGPSTLTFKQKSIPPCSTRRDLLGSYCSTIVPTILPSKVQFSLQSSAYPQSDRLCF